MPKKVFSSIITFNKGVCRLLIRVKISAVSDFFILAFDFHIPFLLQHLIHNHERTSHSELYSHWQKCQGEQKPSRSNTSVGWWAKNMQDAMLQIVSSKKIKFFDLWFVFNKKHYSNDGYFSWLCIRYACICKYMYTHPTIQIYEKNIKLKSSGPPAPPSYPGKTISSSAGGITCMGWSTDFCQETVCDNFLLIVHRGNTQFMQPVVNTCLNILMALLCSLQGSAHHCCCRVHVTSFPQLYEMQLFSLYFYYFLRFYRGSGSLVQCFVWH